MYSRLCDSYYAREAPIPLDPVAACRLVRATSSVARKAVATILPEFFVKREDGWHHKRCDEEIAKYREKSEKAAKSASSRWSERNANASRSPTTNAMRTHMLTQCDGNANQEPITKNQEEPKTLNPLSDSPPNPAAPSDVVPLEIDKSKPPRLAAEAGEILDFLNARTGHFYRRTANTLKPIMARLKEGYTVRECKAVIARKFREWGRDEEMAKYLRPSTLFGAEKFSQYVGDVPPAEVADGA
jgi:uncharacterized phage protein (TIGR02220 family)